MSDRFVTITVETRAGEDEITGEEITAIYRFDLAEDGAEIEHRFHKEIHDHLLHLLEQYREEPE